MEEREKRGRAIKKNSTLYDSLSVTQKKTLSSFKDVLCCKTVRDLPKAHSVPQDPSNADSKGTLVSKADKKFGFQVSWGHL